MTFIEKMEFLFPVEKLTTSLEWDDLILNPETREAIILMEKSLEVRNDLKAVRASLPREQTGFKAVFFGPSGTGKTIAATILAKNTGLDVYRIDLSLVLSKYIGETEKNLSRLFARAEENDWILFFDEADALFGKRTGVSDAHDRYANQEVSYLLQRMDSFQGLMILAFNNRLNLNLPFFKRFKHIAEFHIPGADQRLELWRKYLPQKAAAESEIDIQEISREYELTGGKIVNAIRHAAAGRKNILSKKKLLDFVKKMASEEDSFA